MTVKPNRIIVPARYDIKIEILWDSLNGQTELKVVSGQILNLKLLGLLQEHALGITKQMMGMVPITPIVEKPFTKDNGDNGNNGGLPNAS